MAARTLGDVHTDIKTQQAIMKNPRTNVGSRRRAEQRLQRFRAEFIGHPELSAVMPGMVERYQDESAKGAIGSAVQRTAFAQSTSDELPKGRTISKYKPASGPDYHRHLQSLSSKFYDDDFQYVMNIPTHTFAMQKLRDELRQPMIIGYKNSPYSIKSDREHLRNQGREYGRVEHRLKKKPYRIDRNSIATHKVLTQQLNRRLKKKKKQKAKGGNLYHIPDEPDSNYQYPVFA